MNAWQISAAILAVVPIFLVSFFGLCWLQADSESTEKQKIFAVVTSLAASVTIVCAYLFLVGMFQ